MMKRENREFLIGGIYGLAIALLIIGTAWLVIWAIRALVSP